jgi:hypothetical protein
MKPPMNKQAPLKILIGDFPRKYRAAKQWASSKHDVPVFFKRAVNCWEYRGDYHVVGSNEEPKTVEMEKIAGEDPHVRIVLYLEPASD